MASPSLDGVIHVPLDMYKKMNLEVSDEFFSEQDFVYEKVEEPRQTVKDIQIIDED